MDPKRIKSQYVELLDDFSERYTAKDAMYALSNKVRYEMILAEIDSLDNKCLLDVGCGTGMFELLAAGRGGKFTGIDISRPNIRRARELVGRNGSIRFRVADAENLPFKSGTFDIIVASEVLEHVPDIEKALKEIKRVAKAGATVIITVPNLGNPMCFFGNYQFHLFRYIKGLFRGYDDVGYFVRGRGRLAERHIYYRLGFFEKIASNYFRIQKKRTTFLGIARTLPIIPLKLQRLAASLSGVDLFPFRNLGAQLFLKCTNC